VGNWPRRLGTHTGWVLVPSQYPLIQPPTTPQAQESGEVRIFHHVRLTLGFCWRPDGTEEEIRDIRGTPVVFPKTPPGVRLDFGDLHSEDLRVDVPVLVNKRI
jgi:hypothetical protein